MNISALQHIRKAVQTLNPKTVRELSEKDLNIALYAATNEDYLRMEEFFLNSLSQARRQEAAACLHRNPDAKQVLEFDLAIYDESVLAPRRALIYRSGEPERLVKEIIDQFDDTIRLPLARTFHAFRMPYIEHIIQVTSRENAFFSVATALPDVIPSLIELPWAVTEFASDTAVLTANQIKMAFLIAAASDREVGYREQQREIAAVIGGAFGWRAIARQLVGKIPLGGGLLPKAAIAYGATKLVGVSLERLYRVGYGYTRHERREIYSDAFEHGRKVAGNILKTIRPNPATKNFPDVDELKEHQGTSN